MSTWTAEFSKGFWIGLGVGASLVVLAMITRVVGQMGTLGTILVIAGAILLAGYLTKKTGIAQMAGLNLGMGTFGGSMSQGAVPAAAGVSPGAPTIAQRAFGVQSANQSVGPRTAGFGTVALGIAGAAILVYLWWSLPRQEAGMVKGFVLGLVTYWAVQHFTGIGSTGKGSQGMVLAWLTGWGIITYRSIRQDGHAPVPGQLVAASFVFIALGFLHEIPSARFLASATAWGFDVAALMNVLPGAVTGGTTTGSTKLPGGPPPTGTREVS